MTLYFAVRDPRTPRLAKFIAALTVAYALSPIDLIPDFIPVLGYLDDLILIPIAISICLRLIPHQVISDARLRAGQTEARPRNYVAAGVIVIIWAALLIGFSYWSYVEFFGQAG